LTGWKLSVFPIFLAVELASKLRRLIDARRQKERAAADIGSLQARIQDLAAQSNKRCPGKRRTNIGNAKRPHTIEGSKREGYFQLNILCHSGYPMRYMKSSTPMLCSSEAV
jgi:hypothetical protein